MVGYRGLFFPDVAKHGLLLAAKNESTKYLKEGARENVKSLARCLNTGME